MKSPSGVAARGQDHANRRLICAVACRIWRTRRVAVWGAACLSAVVALEALASEPGTSASAPSAPVSFIREVAPILESRCKACHGSKTAESNYRLDTFARLMTAGDYEMAPITAGDPDDSELLRLIEAEDEDERMPANGDQLAAAEIATIRQWIEQGAKFDGQSTDTPLVEQIPRLAHASPPDTYPAAVPVTAIAFWPGDKRLVTGGYHELLVWDVETGDLVERIGDMPQQIRKIVFGPDGSWLAVAGGSAGISGEVRVISTDADHAIKFYTRQPHLIFDVAVRPDGQQLAIAAADGTVQLWDIAGAKLERQLEFHGDWVTSVAYSPDGTQLVSTSRDKTAKVVNVESGEMVSTYSGHGQIVHDAVFAADGKHVFTAGDDNKIHMWNPADGKKAAEIAGFGGGVQSVDIVGETLIASSADRSVRRYKLADRSAVSTLTDHPDWVLSAAENSAGSLVVGGCFDGTVRIWNVADGTQVQQFIAKP